MAALQIAGGAACGVLCARIAGLQDSKDCATESARFRQAVTASAFGNATTLPLVLGTSLCATVPQLALDTGASGRFVGYLALYQLAWSVCLWTLGYSYLVDPSAVSETSKGLSASQKIQAVGSRLASPPSLGSLGGAAMGFFGLGSAPPVTSPAFSIYSAVNLLGQGAQPALAMVLSLTLLGTTDMIEESGQEGTSDGLPDRPLGPAPAWMSTLDLPQLSATVAARGLLLPIIGGAVVEWAWHRPGLLPEDPVAHLVLLLETTMPSAQVLVLLAQVPPPPPPPPPPQTLARCTQTTAARSNSYYTSGNSIHQR